ncbi:hypothetical protein NC652_019367 [Populus alba x Populus x berolinensis]|uniref:Uncharacterized protein n=2 Tax=Populus TaxID=3689 RepID=A0ACC4C0C4_POPAL|nr:hypothetical protein NC652_019367 [Populus alba x Populus x berolinensis]KAJ6990901.1 hypothetical protein NC653_019209 [Populus alba x Populus x berolinensis]
MTRLCCPMSVSLTTFVSKFARRSNCQSLGSSAGDLREKDNSTVKGYNSLNESTTYGTQSSNKEHQWDHLTSTIFMDFCDV